MAIETPAGEKRFTIDAVREVAVRGYSLRKGALIGAGVFAVLGALAVCAHEGGADCLIVGPLGAAASGAQANLLEDLALRVNLDDQLRVEDRSGVRTTGRLTRLTPDEISIHTGAGERHFTRETVRQVAVRRHPLRMAILIGAGAGAAAGAVAACTGSKREECADAPIIAGAIGAGLGLAAGSLVHRITIVYPEPEKRAFVVPAISRGAVGVLVSRRW
jgi:hypothetical protein